MTSIDGARQIRERFVSFSHFYTINSGTSKTPRRSCKQTPQPEPHRVTRPGSSLRIGIGNGNGNGHGNGIGNGTADIIMKHANLTSLQFKARLRRRAHSIQNDANSPQSDKSKTKSNHPTKYKKPNMYYYHSMSDPQTRLTWSSPMTNSHRLCGLTLIRHSGANMAMRS